MSTTQEVQKWHSKVMFPKDNYTVRCMEEGFGPSNSSGKPMITLEFEIDSPEVVSIAGVEYGVAGQKTSKKYIVVKSVDKEGNEDTSKSANLQRQAGEIYKAFGLPIPEDWDNPPLGFKGKLVWALLSDNEQEQRKTPTPEQVKKGLPGDIIKHPITHQPLVSHYPEINQIFGLAEANANKPF